MHRFATMASSYPPVPSGTSVFASALQGAAGDVLIVIGVIVLIGLALGVLVLLGGAMVNAVADLDVGFWLSCLVAGAIIVLIAIALGLSLPSTLVIGGVVLLFLLWTQG